MDAQKLLDNFSTHLKNVIAQAISHAAQEHHTHVDPLILLYTLSKERGCVAFEILKKYDITPELIEEFRQNLEIQIPTDKKTTLPELSPAARQILEKALVLSHEQEHTYIGTEHLLYGLITSKYKPLIHFWAHINIDLDEIQNQIDISFHNATRLSHMGDIAEMLGNIEDQPPQNMQPLPPPSQIMPQMPGTKSSMSAIAQFTTNLSAKQYAEKIDPVIGRDAEIGRIINILARRTKNNPILVGEPGVGKTAIVEGLAKRIASGDVPDILKQKKVLSLDLTLLIAGTIYRGEFESRLKQIVDEATKNPHYILFIDELHNIIGAGSNQGTMDAANILKPALARGQLRCIGATTYDEYKKYISTDPALERRFQKIDIEEPHKEDTLSILIGVKKYYEQFHHVSITQKAIDEAVHLSNRYIHDNFQPDKSIDLIDEAAALVKASQKSSPQSIKLFALEQQLHELTSEKDNAIASEKLKIALKLKEKITTLNKKITILRKDTKKTKTIPRVTEKHIQHIVSTKMHIDPTILSQNEWENIKTLGSRLKQHIIGQDDVIDTIVTTLHRAQLGMTTDKPFASFLFVGPSGVGKTELAKQIAHELYHDKKALIKLDMGEFSESHSVSKLLGSPAGYIGYKDRNHFIEQIKQRPYAVILFDEIDKAHPDVTKLLLHMLDEGYISDGNKKISLHHTTIILTANIGSELFKSHGIGFGTLEKTQEKELRETIIRYTKEQLTPAIMSRIIATTIFHPLSELDITKITSLHIDRVAQHIVNTQKIYLTFDQKAQQNIIAQTSSSDNGARMVGRHIENIMQEILVDILKKKTQKKSYTISYKNDFTTL